MSDTLNKMVEALNTKDASDFGGNAKFVVEDEGAIMLTSAGARVADEEADVTFTASVETYQAIFEGELAPTSAFMTGKLSIDGNMGLAMQLASVLG
jgi:putative sterol carrier protein